MGGVEEAAAVWSIGVVGAAAVWSIGAAAVTWYSPLQ